MSQIATGRSRKTRVRTEGTSVSGWGTDWTSSPTTAAPAARPTLVPTAVTVQKGEGALAVAIGTTVVTVRTVKAARRPRGRGPRREPSGFIGTPVTAAGSLRPGRIGDALNHGRAVEAGNEAFQVVRIDGPVRGVRTVLEPLDERLYEFLLEVSARMSGDDLVHLVSSSPSRPQPTASVRTP